MSPNEQAILALAQQIYRVMNKTSNQNISNPDDLKTFIDDTIDWVNQFLPELEAEAYWGFSRANDDTVGSADSSQTTYQLPSNLRTLVVNEHRDLTIRQDGSTVATFKIVNPNQERNPNDYDTRDRVALVGRRLIFSRPFNSAEQGGDIVADSIAYIPRISRQNVDMLDIVTPLQLVVLGVAKNWILPDKVSGGLSASFAQKYADLLEKAKTENDASSDAYDVVRDSFGYIGGVGW